MKARDKIKILIKMPKYIFSYITKPAPRVMDNVDTADYIVNNECSIARFADGELDIMCGVGIVFQKSDDLLKQRLCEVAKSTNEKVLICIPNIFVDNDVLPRYFSQKSCNFWKKHKLVFGGMYRAFFKKLCGDSQFTRFYLEAPAGSDMSDYFLKLKQMWQGKRVLIVEGKHTKMGVGNDLFDNTLGVRRIVCPDKDAFDKYDEILDAASSMILPDEMVICALGPTATVLCYDLQVKYGIRSLDLGHIDIEYEWFLQKADSKVSIEGKHSAESKDPYIDGLNKVDNVICVID